MKKTEMEFSHEGKKSSIPVKVFKSEEEMRRRKGGDRVADSIKKRTTSDGYMPRKQEEKKESVKGYKHAVQHTTSGEKRGYKDPESGLIHPSKGAFKDRYQKK